MQQLQKSVLNKLQLGVHPVFIISPNIPDGEPLALLLSEYLVFSTNTYKRNVFNYFFNDEARKLFSSGQDTKVEKEEKELILKVSDKKAKKEIAGDVAELHQELKPAKTPEREAEIRKKKQVELKSSLQFIIEKGFDNIDMWGIQLDYQLFFDLEVDILFPDAFFIFLYGTKIKKYHPHLSKDDFYNRVVDFTNRNGSNCLVFHVNNTIYTPELVLQNMPIGQGLEIGKFSSKADISLSKRNTDLYHYSADASDQQLKRDLDNANPLSAPDCWIEGSEMLCLLILNDYSNSEHIVGKIQQLTGSFLSTPSIYVICRNEVEKRFVQQLVAELKKNISSLTVIACHTNISTEVNELIQGSAGRYVVVDYLHSAYSVVNTLHPLKISEGPAFTFGNLNSDRINEDDSTKVQLVDILTVRSAPDNISFLKSTWQALGGFDTLLENKAAIWDFAIRCFRTKQSYAIETEAIIPKGEEYTDADSVYEDIERNMIPYEGYKEIIEKHRSLFEENLNKVVKVFSENQHIPEHEIGKLKYTVSSLNSWLSHSKHEITALSETKKQLQHHIDLLESRWHFKVVHRLVHLKNIFFKKGTAGSNVFINILKFIIFSFTRPGLKLIRKLFKGILKKLYILFEDRPVKIVYLDYGKDGTGEAFNNYHDWIINKLDEKKLKSEYDKNKEKFTVRPKISVVMPVYDPKVTYLDDAIRSVVDQFYDNWELCIADDCSPNPQIKRLLNSYALKDSRIKVFFRPENGHISACSNSALALATGDYIMLLDHDDLLTPDCMAEVVKHINEHPEHDFIYSDEDKVDDLRTFSNPFFKPDWSPDRFLALNYVAHVVVIKKTIMDKVGGWRLGYEGSQDYDLVLRITEETTQIGHIAKILYHWRIHNLSVASGAGDAKPYAYIAAKKAITEAMIRRNIPAKVHYTDLRGCYRIKYEVTAFEKVSIIIPTKDQAAMMKNTIDSIFAITSYPNFEVIVLNNNSTTKEFFELMDVYTEQYGARFRCIEANFPFNFSKLMNTGVAASTGEYILLLNNDVEIIQNDWITTMVSFAQQKRIGAVGVRLLYPNDNIQHAGTILGLGAAAGHIYVGAYKDTIGYFNCLRLTTNYSAVTAACLMLRKSVYNEVGGMEEKLEVEYNDVDFCLRIMEHGYFNIYVPDVTLYHYESATRGHPHQTKASYQRHLREVKYFQDTWGKYIKNDPFYNPHLSYERADSSINFNS